MTNKNVKIIELNAYNWYECYELGVSKERSDYIESNAISIAQSKFEPTLNLMLFILKKK
ncbi:hypothetical protein J2S17_005900 [Cytobacillus purgationiresistens]|uniref:Uncharacterized protein n=1 Tax=Cytobacillus purgationiresistens TaxID=863449 RepID=A0ABU0ARQ3_9BACI|nr:hypothetical protein [Cytobacillus purgationiresistens]